MILCDEELYGKEFSEGKKILKITSFYKGESVTDVDENIIKRMDIINAIGKKSIELLIKKKIISNEDLNEVKYIQGVPYVFIVRE